MRQKISIRLSNFVNHIVKSNSKKGGGDQLIIDEKNYPRYLLFGFNESYDNTKLYRLLTQSIPQKKDGGETTDYLLVGDLNDPFEVPKSFLQNQFKSSYDPNTIYPDVYDPFACIVCEFRVPIQKTNGKVVMSRQGKVVVAYIDQIHVEQTHHIIMKNRNSQIMVEFDLKIKAFECWRENSEITRETLRTFSRNKQFIQSLREWIWEDHKKITKKWIHDASRRSSSFKRNAPGMERFDLWSDPSFLGVRPTNSYLFYRISTSNELYWKKLVHYELLCRKTEYDVSPDLDDDKFFDSLSTNDQVAVLVDIHGCVSVNTPYCSDYIVNPEDGSLKSTDEYSNICEGCGDCDDLAANIAFSFLIFQKWGYDAQKKGGLGIQSSTLQKLWKFTQYYVCSLTIAALRLPSDDKSPKIDNHVTTLFTLKLWLLNQVDVRQIEDSETSLNLARIKQTEEAMGNLRTTIKRISSDGMREIDDPLPVILFGEATGKIYPFDTSVYCPPQILKSQEKSFSRPIRYSTMQGRIYHSKKQQFHLRYFLLITNFFITHPTSPTNLPTLYFSYRPKDNLDPYYVSEWKGVTSSDLYKLNKQRRETEDDDDDDVVLIPQAQFGNFENDVRTIQAISRDKFSFTPCISYNQSNTTKDKYPYETNGRSVNSMIYESYLPQIPKNTESGVISTVQPNPVWPYATKEGIMLTLPQNVPTIIKSSQILVNLKNLIPKSFKGCSWAVIPYESFVDFLQTTKLNHVIGHFMCEVNPDVKYFIVWIK